MQKSTNYCVSEKNFSENKLLQCPLVITVSNTNKTLKHFPEKLHSKLLFSTTVCPQVMGICTNVAASSTAKYSEVYL